MQSPPMPKCLDHDFACQNPDYSDFDSVSTAEMVNPPSANEIINHSNFCTFVPIDENLRIDDLTHKDFLKGLNSKNGLYHLWVEYENCDDHDTHTMRCVYVGKGAAEGRVDEHIKKKFPDKEMLYVGFYECSNRISKYLEQLFLDTYNFDLNKNENPGTKTLYAVWDYERYTIGTELHSVSNLSKITSLSDIEQLDG